jgi:catechol 2,3-dioxygenase-like lactoylglutathione lyase family enzyme
MKSSCSIKNITFLTKNIEKSSLFFIDVFGFKLNHSSDNFAEITDINDFKINFIKSNLDSQTRIGYNPIITISVLDFNDILDRLKSYPDIEFDGDIKDNENGKFCCIKNNDGLMIGVVDIKSNELDIEENFDINENSKLDTNMSEIRNILDKIKI